MAGLRFDPSQTKDDLLQALERAAEAARGRTTFYKCVALVQGTNIVRRELGLPEARVRIADPRYVFAAVPGR